MLACLSDNVRIILRVLAKPLLIIMTRLSCIVTCNVNRGGNFIAIQFQPRPESSISSPSVQFREDYGMVLGVDKKTTTHQNIPE